MQEIKNLLDVARDALQKQIQANLAIEPSAESAPGHRLHLESKRIDYEMRASDYQAALNADANKRNEDANRRAFWLNVFLALCALVGAAATAVQAYKAVRP